MRAWLRRRRARREAAGDRPSSDALELLGLLLLVAALYLLLLAGLIWKGVL